MTFREGLLRARSHIIFLLGLVAAFGLVITLERWDIEKNLTTELTIEKTFSISLPVSSPLNKEEQEWAGIAWRYFENNYQPATGLVNSVDQYPASTMWDTASYMMALISAERLQIIDQKTFDTRLSLLLDTLATLQLFEGKLPNKSYNTRTGDMVDYGNNKTKRGIGWSAIDVGRLLTPFNIIVWNYPRHTAAIKNIIQQWSFDAMLKDGLLYGAAVDDAGNTVLVQEGRLGYEEYAAKSLSLLGMDVSTALSYTDHLGFIDIYSIQVPYDSRDPEQFHAHNYVVSEPYVLDGIEYGWDQISREFAFRVYRAQEQRYRATNMLTAVSEDNIDQDPYFVYNTVFTNGKPWNCITEKGDDASRFKSISLKAALGWHMLYRTPYTKRLMKEIGNLHDPEKGWYSGQYELDNSVNKAITCNTNGIVLESLCYKQFGRLVKIYK